MKGGEHGGEIMEDLYNNLAEVSTPRYTETGEYEEDYRMAVIEALDGNQSKTPKKIGLLSNNNSCRPHIFASRDDECEKMKAKYYFAAKELLRLGINKNVFYGEYENKGSSKVEYIASLEHKATKAAGTDSNVVEELHNKGREIAAQTLEEKGKTDAANQLRKEITQPDSSGGKSRRRRNKKSRKARRRKTRKH